MKPIPQDKGGRRSRFERRQFFRTFRSLERRSGIERRTVTDRRKSKRTIWARVDIPFILGKKISSAL